jgi:hypothetical protein
MNKSAMLVRLLRETAADVVMFAGRYILLKRDALDDVLPAAAAEGQECRCSRCLQLRHSLPASTWPGCKSTTNVLRLSLSTALTELPISANSRTSTPRPPLPFRWPIFRGERHSWDEHSKEGPPERGPHPQRGSVALWSDFGTPAHYVRTRRSPHRGNSDSSQT